MNLAYRFGQFGRVPFLEVEEIRSVEFDLDFLPFFLLWLVRTGGGGGGGVGGVVGGHYVFGPLSRSFLLPEDIRFRRGGGGVVRIGGGGG